MFFRRKKDSGQGDKSSRSESGESGSKGGGSPSGGGTTTDESSPTTQFLTGEAGQDRRSVQVLLEAIAQVSEYQDLDALLRDIVDRSVEVTGAERGILLMRSAEGELEVRVSRSKDSEDLDADDKFSTTVARRVLDRVEPVRADGQHRSPRRSTWGARSTTSSCARSCACR